MASINSMSALNSMRMSGLASGMDTESMVESMMRVERLKYERLVQQKTLLDWKKESNLAVNNKLRSFRDEYLSAIKPDKYMLSQNSVLAYKVTMEASSAVKITAGKDALTGSHTVHSVTSLASGANAASAGVISAEGLSLDTELSGLALNTPLAFVDDELSFSINGKEFTFQSTDTLRTMITRVNGDTAANVQMSYSSLTGKITIAGKAMGSEESLTIENLKGNAFDPDSPALGIAAGTFTNGTDAVLNINGVNVVKNTNSFTIDGITYTLADTSATALKFTVEQDIDSAVDKIMAFVDAYNDLITGLGDTLTEQRYADYMPLTEDQLSQMSDTQIEKWESIAKSGMLRNDSYLKRFLQDMRRSFYDTVSGPGASPASLGLGTISYLTNGMIKVDEAKLRKALQENPDKAAQVISGVSNATDSATRYSESGLASRIQTVINSYINDYQGYRTSSANDQYTRLEDNMSRVQKVLVAKEERYWRQFTQMEQSINRLNTQSNWLAEQFASNG